MSRAHIAGPSITIAGRYHRQRCSWCGEALIDDDLGNMAGLEGDPTGPLKFPVGELVEVEEGNPRRCSLLASETNEAGEGKLPLNFCDPRMVR